MADILIQKRKLYVVIMLMCMLTVANLTFLYLHPKQENGLGYTINRAMKAYPFLFGLTSLPCLTTSGYKIYAALIINGSPSLVVAKGNDTYFIDSTTFTVDGLPVMDISEEGMIIMRHGMAEKICFSAPVDS